MKIIIIKKLLLTYILLLCFVINISCKTIPAQNTHPAKIFNTEKAISFFDEGVRFNKEQKFDKAIISFTEAIRILPSFQRAYITRGSVYYVLGRYSEAIKDFDNAILLGFQNNTDYALGHYMKGRSLSALGEYGKAIEIFSYTLRITPFSADVYNERGLAHYRTGNLTDAFADFNFAISIDSSNFNFFDNRGTIFYHLGMHGRALEDFLISLMLNPNNAFAAKNIGAILKELERYDASLEFFNMAITIDPSLLSAYYGRGRLYIILAELTNDITKRNEYLEKSKADFERSR